MSLPQCDAFGYIYEPDGTPTVGLLVTLQKVLDAAGNPIALDPRTTTTDSTGRYSFNLPQNSTAYLTARASTFSQCNGGSPFKVPASTSGQLVPAFVPGGSLVAPPLVYAGGVLSIPQASASQDGYLSAEDWATFNAGGAASGGVISFNGRQGNVVSETSDYSVFSSTAPGFAPSAPAPSGKFLRDDGTWQPAATSLGEYFVTDYKASGSQNTYFGQVLAGQTALTTTAATDFVVGQGIWIEAAGPSGQPLLTKVMAVAGTSITIQNAATSAVLSAKVQHDDTVAIQAAIDAAFNAGGGTVIFPFGFYRINGPLTSFNSILKLPFVVNTPVGGPATAIRLIGDNQAFPTYKGTLQTKGGAVLQTDRVTSDYNASMIACNAWASFSGGGVDQFSALTVFMQGLTFRTYDNPKISGIDMGMAGNAILKEISIDTGVALQSISQPMQNQFALRTPQVSTGIAADAFDMVYVQGYYTGIWFAEQFRSTWFAIQRCKVGMECGFSYHPAWGIGLISECPTIMNITDRQSFDMSLDLQPDLGSNWYSAVIGRDFVDPGNKATGQIRYAKIATMTGNAYTPSNTGAANLQFVNLNAFIDTTPPVISSVASSGLTGSSATITWTTDEGADSQVEYGTTTSYGSSTTLNTTLVTSHSQNVTGLAVSTLYHYRVHSKDAAGNPSVSGDFTFTTTGTPDTTPPVISSVASSGITTSTATVTWTTNEVADSQVEYGTSTSYGSSTTLNPALVTSHSVNLSGLSASTLYHYRVKSKDAAANLATSGDFTFTTTASGSGTILAKCRDYWKLDETSGNRASALGNGHDFAPVGTVASAAGKINNALSLSGSGRLVIGSLPAYEATGDYCWAAWVKLNSKSGNMDFLSKAGVPGHNDEYIFGYDQASDRFRHTVYAAATWTTQLANSFGSPAINTWYFVVCQRDATANTISIQIGTASTLGAVDSTGAGFIIVDSADLNMGSFGGGVANQWDGLIDEIGIFDKLTSSEVTQLWNGGTGLTYPF